MGSLTFWHLFVSVSRLESPERQVVLSVRQYDVIVFSSTLPLMFYKSLVVLPRVVCRPPVINTFLVCSFTTYI